MADVVSGNSRIDAMTAKTEPKDRPDKRTLVTGRLRHALDLMIWGGQDSKPLDWNDAARAVNISARSMRKSLERPAVRQYLLTQKQVLRACISAKSLSRLDELAAQRSNMNAAVNAIRAIDESEAVERPLMGERPGVTIVIQQPTGAPPPTIDAQPAPTLHTFDNARGRAVAVVGPPDPIFRHPSR
jgi:hypothetical protein